jgi:type IV pilus assembly protein PilM
MALSLRNSSNGGPVGLDIDGDFIAAVVLSGARVSSAASADLPPGTMSEGEVRDVSGLSDALKDFFKRHSLPRAVRLGVANQQIVVRQIELPPIETESERDAAVRFQAAEAIAMPLDEAVLDYQVVGTSDASDGGARMQVVIVAARRSMIEQLVSAVRSAGLKPEGIDLNAFALVRALRNGSDPPESARVLCHLGGVTNLAIAVGDSCVFTRTLATDWKGEEADAAAGALANEIRLSIDYYMAQPGARPAGQVVLSGPGAAREGLAERLEGTLTLPLAVADPLGAMEAPTLPNDEQPLRHTVAAGLALGAGL